MIDLGLGLETVVASYFAEALGPAEERVGSGGLWEEEEEHEEDGAVEPEHLPEGPAPVFSCNTEAGDDWAYSRSTGGSESPEGEDVGKLDETVDVLKCGTTRRETGATEDALQESKNNEAGEVVYESSRDQENDEDGVRDNVRRIATDAWYFGKWREYQWSDAVAKYVHRQRQGCRTERDPETLHNTSGARSIDSTSHVYTSRVYQDLSEHYCFLPKCPVLGVLRIIGSIPIHKDCSITQLLGLNGPRRPPFDRSKRHLLL